MCLSKDSIRRKSRLWPQNASSVLNIHAMPGQKHASSHFIPIESKVKSKLLSNINSIISNDNEILVWGSATHSLSWKHYQSTATTFLLPQTGQHPTPRAHKQTGVRNCLFRAEEKQERHLSANSKDSATGVWNCNTSQGFHFFSTTSVLFWDGAYCSATVLVTCRK